METREIAIILFLALVATLCFALYSRYKELYHESRSKLIQSKTEHSEYVANAEQTISRLTDENAKLRAKAKCSTDYIGFDDTK